MHAMQRTVRMHAFEGCTNERTVKIMENPFGNRASQLCEFFKTTLTLIEFIGAPTKPKFRKQFCLHVLNLGDPHGNLPDVTMEYWY